MPTQFLNVTFDGVNDVPRLPGDGSVSWSTGGSRPTIDRYSVFVDAPDDLDATLNLTGSDWRIRMLQVAGDDHITRIVDGDTGSGREIEYLNLGYNSEVDLTSTRVRYMNGWEGDRHDITLGSENDWMHWLNLGADVNVVDTAVGWVGGIDIYRGRGDVTVRGDVQNIGFRSTDDNLVVDDGFVFSARMRGGDDTVIVRNGGRIGVLEDFGGASDVRVLKDSRLDSFRGGEGDVSIALFGSARAESIRVYESDLTFSSKKGYVQSIYGWEVDSDVTIGSGGIATIKFVSDAARSHDITGSADGYIGSIETTDSRDDATDDQSAVVNLSYFAGSVRLGNGADRVTTGNGETGWVENISTSGGNDVVTLGSGGAVTVGTSRGNDRINLQDLFYNEAEDGVALRGGAGTDTLSFQAFSLGVAVNLDLSGAYQEVATGAGFFSIIGIENLIGSQHADMLTGTAIKNVISGKSGADLILGGGGNDTIKGDAGNDMLFGQLGRDTVIGGAGRDTIDGGFGNDTLRGNGGGDTFVFGNKSGTDTVADFTDGSDILRLVGHTGGFGDLTFSNAGGNREIEHDNGTIVLAGQAGLVLTQADFDFVVA
ncbi:calcium-binding protein [Microbulbifer sp. S227A]|uniref:calcium-binding protein n=1 Tax=Microbulbifer sp. S227A TaxID=3415131 RepID=UPI003C7B92F0